MKHILIVDDEPAIRSSLKRFLSEQGYAVTVSSSSEEALKVLEEGPVHVSLVDLVMPKMDGIELIHKMKEIQPEIVPIVITGFGTITSAIQAMKAGAFHYITKPFELDDISLIIHAALEHYTLREENFSLRSQLSTESKYKNIIGKSDEIKAVFDLVDKVAGTDSTVLILGESGTGKELVARAVHNNSRRSDKPLVTVNCAAIPEGLLESELFGHVKGAYTGAVSTVPGRFDNADKSTIFLDEIGDMSFKLQVKLLRVLQEQSFKPVGSAKTHQVNVRVVAATNQDLEKAVKEKKFREDLYYRLNVIPVHIPPLRERKEDVIFLAEHFIEKFNNENKCDIQGIDDTALKVLTEYNWPGNVRELENMIERIAVLKRSGKIELADLPAKLEAFKESATMTGKELVANDSVSFKKAVSDYESALIKQALERAGWNKNKAANLLQLNRTTLVEKIKKLGLTKQVVSRWSLVRPPRID